MLVVIGVLAATLLVVGIGHPAQAHFFVKDADTGLRGLFHVTPDHDPIAGEESIISYDFAKTDTQVGDYTFRLMVKGTKTESANVVADVSGNVVLASYVFPSQGFYTITLIATNQQDGVVSELNYGQRVSRGEVREESKALKPFEIIMISGIAVISIGAIIFSIVNDKRKRKEEK